MKFYVKYIYFSCIILHSWKLDRIQNPEESYTDPKGFPLTLLWWAANKFKAGDNWEMHTRDKMWVLVRNYLKWLGKKFKQKILLFKIKEIIVLKYHWFEFF